MPTTRNRWQQEIQPSPEPAAADNQANQANTPTIERQTSPPRPSVSPASELADDFQDDPSPRSPKRQRLNYDGADGPLVPRPGQSMPTTDTAVNEVSNNHDAASVAQPPNGQGAKPDTGLTAPSGTDALAPTPNQHQQTHAPAQQHSSLGAPANVQPMPPTFATHLPSTTVGDQNPKSSQERAASQTPKPTTEPTGSPSVPPSMPQPAAVQHHTSAAPPVTANNASKPPAGPQIPPSAALPTPSQPGAPPPATVNQTTRGPPPPPVEVIQRRLDNLSRLNELADQVLVLLSKMPVLDALALDADLRLLSSGQQPSSPAPAEYQRLRALFDPVRNMYVTGFPFLIANHLAMREPSQAAIIRKANQAMFCSAIFAGGIGQLALDQAFLDIFVPENGQLLKAQSNIWLELKTQGFMTAMRLKAAPPNQVMSDLFPAGIESRIVARHPASQTLTPSEQDFAARYEARRKILFEHISRSALPELDQKFTYVELATQVANFLIMTYGVGSVVIKQANTAGLAANNAPNPLQTLSPAPTVAGTNLPPVQLPASMESLPSFDSSDFIELAARAAAIAMRGIASPLPTSAAPVIQSPPVSQTAPGAQSQSHASTSHDSNTQNGSIGNPHVPLGPTSQLPHASQSAPTHVLYHRARVADPLKSTTPSTPRAEGDVSQQRRTWTEEEEKALMDGLDRVQGPHWAQIMALYGPGGSLNETLKEKNQVQLKDKARNLKLFFLKNKIEVPYFLSQVTGTLETRAPGQAERSEPDAMGSNTKEAEPSDAKSTTGQNLGQSHGETMEDVQFHDQSHVDITAPLQERPDDIKMEHTAERPEASY